MGWSSQMAMGRQGSGSMEDAPADTHKHSPLWRRVKPALGLLLYLSAWIGLWGLSHQLWFLPAGLRLGVLWASPMRWWPWIACTEIFGLSVFGALQGHDPSEWRSLSVNVLPWLVYALVVAAMRRGRRPRTMDSPLVMARLLGAGLLAAAAVSPLLYLLYDGAASAPDLMLGAFNYMLGDLVGQVTLAPLLVLLLARGGERLRIGLWAGDAVIYLLPVIGLIVLAMLRFPEAAGFAYLLAFGPLLLMAFRHGWHGPALALPLVGLSLEFCTRLEPASLVQPTLQVGLIAMGAGALMLGAATSALRESHQQLRHRNAELTESNYALRLLASETREMAQRLNRLQEQGQRELAAELHDELGQAVTALATRINLALRRAEDPEMRVMLESLRAQIHSVHESLRRALRQIRPAVLDAYGLQRALAEGPPRELLEDARISYRPIFIGDIDVLDDDATTAIYRICQEAVTNCVRHARASELSLRLAVHRLPDGRGYCVELELSDDGVGMEKRTIRGGMGLAGIRSRVLAMGGDYQFITGPDGTSHRIAFDQLAGR